MNATKTSDQKQIPTQAKPKHKPKKHVINTRKSRGSQQASVPFMDMRKFFVKQAGEDQTTATKEGGLDGMG